MRNNGEDLYENFLTVDRGIKLMSDNIDLLKSNVINLQENIDKTKIDPEKVFNELEKIRLILKFKGILFAKFKPKRKSNRII